MENKFNENYILDKQEYCWIHINEIKTFLYIGANELEKRIGQNVTIHLSIKIKFLHTFDDLNQTVDYGDVIEHVIHKIKSLNRVRLVEYLAEQILNDLGEKFPKIAAAKLIIEKGYVPLKDFTGKIKIEAQRNYEA
jgi:FolB domain-containing protein